MRDPREAAQPSRASEPKQGKEGGEEWNGGTDQSRVVVRVPLVHGDGLAADDEEAEVAVLVADGVHAEVVHPPGVLRRAPAAAPAPAAPAAEVRRSRLRELHLGDISRRSRRRSRRRPHGHGHLPRRAWGWIPTVKGGG